MKGWTATRNNRQLARNRHDRLIDLEGPRRRSKSPWVGSSRLSGYLPWLQTFLLTRSAKPPSGFLPNSSSWVAFLLTTKRPL